MPKSANGWVASADRESIDVEPFVVDGVSFPGGVKAGAVATVLGYVAREFDRRVEPLVKGWCWGHNYREIAGSTWLSNHASGTAIDINAPEHGYGARGTFTKEQVRAIRSILAEINGDDVIVRWGGDYSGSGVDEMHFEIHAGGTAVAAAARRLTQQNEEDEFLASLSQYQQNTVFTAAQRVLGITSQAYWVKNAQGAWVTDANGQRAVVHHPDQHPAGGSTVPVTLPDRADTSHLAMRLGQLDDKTDTVLADTGDIADQVTRLTETIQQQTTAIRDLVDVVRDLAGKIDPPPTNATSQEGP